jgi:hypothetical protein
LLKAEVIDFNRIRKGEEFEHSRNLRMMSWSLREEIRTVFDLFAEYGGYQVHHGEGLRIRTFTQSPGDVVGQRVYRSFPTPRPLSDLFAQENLPASFFSNVKYCIGRGSLVKLLHAIRQDLSYHHKPFTLKLTRKEGPGPNGSRYIVIEDTEEWNTNPSYGHSIAPSNGHRGRFLSSSSQ